MRNAFSNAVISYFTPRTFSVERNCANVLYAYDSDTDHRTYLTDSDEHKGIALEIRNDSGHEILHICIDGGIIEYGLEDYVGDGQPHGRCDCMVFSNEKLVFVELKMNTVTTKDKKIWHVCSDAMKQIEDFSNHLKNVFAVHNDSFFNYYPKGRAYAQVCIKTAPGMAPTRNSQRLTEKDSFTARTDLKVDFKTRIDF